MLESIFGNSVIEKVLFFLLKNEKAYATELKQVFDGQLYSFQVALDRLESGGIIVSQMVGRTRVYQFNPRSPTARELQQFLEKCYFFLPDNVRKKYYERPVRKRPRRKGKPL